MDTQLHEYMGLCSLTMTCRICMHTAPQSFFINLYNKAGPTMVCEIILEWLTLSEQSFIYSTLSYGEEIHVFFPVWFRPKFASLAFKNWFITPALLLLAVLGHACVSWPIGGDRLFGRWALKRQQLKQIVIDRGGIQCLSIGQHENTGGYEQNQ